MCLWALLGAVILVTARHKEQMLAGRIVAYVYIGMELAIVPVLQSELTPAPIRGLVVGTYQSGLLVSRSLLSCPKGTNFQYSSANLYKHSSAVAQVRLKETVRGESRWGCSS